VISAGAWSAPAPFDNAP